MHLDRRSLLLIAIFPPFAVGLLNQFWLEAVYRQGIGWFYLADAVQWIVVPSLVWLFVLHPAGILPKDFGLDFSCHRKQPVEAMGLFLFISLLLWAAFSPVNEVAYRVLWRYAGDSTYGDAIPTHLPWRTLVVFYYSISAALVEEVVFRGLPWAYACLVLPTPRKERVVWYVVITSLLFAATHSEQGPHGMIAALSFGIVAAFLYTKIQNLWPFVAGHFVSDVLAFWHQ